MSADLRCRDPSSSLGLSSLNKEWSAFLLHCVSSADCPNGRAYLQPGGIVSQQPSGF
jgi:hypothetical protein